MAERNYLLALGGPDVNEEFSGLKTITRRFKVKGDAMREASVDAEVLRAYGTADDEFENALLVERRLEPVKSSPGAIDEVLIEVYKEFEEGQKTAVGQDEVSYDDSGRKSVLRRFVSLATEAEALTSAIGSVSSGMACAATQVQKQGVGALIAETFIESGKISETTETSNNGALTKKTLVYFNEVPPTPAGFTIVNTQVQNEDGVPTYTYTFAKGTGLVSSSVDIRNNGKLVIYGKVFLGGVPTAPAATIGGTVVSIRRDVREQDGYQIYDYQWAEGNGRIAERIETRDTGLRVQTYVALGIKETPTGVVVEDDQDEIEGVTRYTVSCIQNPSGGSPTSGTFSFQRYVPFLYPGRAKAYTTTIGTQTMLNVFLSPPIEAEVLGTVQISYQSSTSLGGLPSTRWQPREWATVIAKWISLNNAPNSKIEGLRGYRSVNSSTITFTAPTLAGIPGGSIFGSTIYGGTTASLQVTGGPEDPGGNSYVLEARLDPAFTSKTGQIYYRRTVITATIPTQAALPV